MYLTLMLKQYLQDVMVSGTNCIPKEKKNHTTVEAYSFKILNIDKEFWGMQLFFSQLKDVTYT